jgi:hypothetical protein
MTTDGKYQQIVSKISRNVIEEIARFVSWHIMLLHDRTYLVHHQ